MGAGKGWSCAEHVNLAKAWVSISTDSIIGTGQKGEAFYDKVYKKWKSMTESYKE